MRYFIFTIIGTFLLALSLPALAQKFEIKAIDFNDKKAQTQNPKSEYYYPKLMKEFLSNDTTMNFDKYRYLYYGYVYQEDYNPFRESPFADKVEDLYYKKTFTRAAIRQYRLNHIMATILSSGNGTAESPWALLSQAQTFYQWESKLTGCHSTEVADFPTAHLWIPEGCQQVKAVVLAQQNMTEERIFKMPEFREQMARLGVAEVWVGPAFSQNWSPQSECQPVFERMMDSLAVVSGHQELSAAPIVPLGHSAQATFPWNFAAWNPARTLCIISFHGDAPRTNLCGYGRENVEWGRTRNIDGIPGLMVEGEYEWWEARVNPALAFRMMYPESCISFLCDTGRGHFDCSKPTALYLARFIEKSLEQRLLPDGTLRKLNPKEGWLADRYRPDMAGTDGADKGKMPQQVKVSHPVPAPFASYKGDPHDAFWYFDQEMAEDAQKRYTDTWGRKKQTVGIRWQGKLVAPDHSQGGMSIDLLQTSDEQEFVIEAVFTDSTQIHLSKQHAATRPRMEIICGPAVQVNDSTFRLYKHEAGENNPRRSFTIWVCAVADGDSQYKGAVQPVAIRINRK